MKVKYLLPCRCGRQIIIEPRQAGEVVVCECGMSLEAPTMLEIGALEPAPAESSPPQSGAAWGWRGRLRFLGAVLLLAAMIAGLCLHLNPPVSPFDAIAPETIQQVYRELSPARTWDIWELMKQGLDRRTDRRYAAALARFRFKQGVVVALALAGVGLIAVGVAPTGRRPESGGVRL